MSRNPKDYLIATIIILVVAGICFPISSHIGYQAVGLTFLMTVAVLSLFLGRGALLYAAILNFVLWNYFFIPPLFTFRVHSIHDIITLFANLMVAVVGSTLISRIRTSQRTLKASQERLTILNSVLKSLNNTISIKDVVKKAQEGLQTWFQADAVVFLKEKEGEDLSTRAFGNTALVRDEDFGRINEIFHRASSESSSQEITRSGNVHYFPLTEPRGVIGVIGILFPEKDFPEGEKREILRSFISQIASALDREISIDKAKEQEFYHESEKLFQTVLNSISHELRTPISVISSAVSNLKDERTAAIPENRSQICDELTSATERLNLLVENFLDMTRIESGRLKLNKQYCDLADLIGFVVKDLRDELKDHPVRIATEDELPMILADIRLLQQALMNILHNASVYTETGVAIDIRAFRNEDGIILEVADHGKGVSESSLPKLFNKFFRVPGTRSGGTGLGLTIAKAIVEAHGGQIKAGNAPAGGLVISMAFKP